MKKVRLGIIGIGNIGTSHVNHFKAGECPEIDLVAVCDINPDRLAWAKEKLPESVARFDDAIAMMDSGLVEAVVISVPHYDHPTLAIEAMKRHLHVMVEKPAGVYSVQVREMNEVAESADVTFGMMFNQRTNCVYRKMKEIVDSGEMGNIRRVNWIITNWYRSQAYYDSGSWRATWSGEGGGVLLNQCPHQLDMLQWICGMPTMVDAHVHLGKWHDIEVEDDVTAYMEFPNGATGLFITSTGDMPGSNRFEITLDKGKLVVEDEKLYQWKLDVAEPEFSKTNKEVFAQPAVTFSEVETDGENPQHNGVLDAFAANILHGAPLVADGKEGINGVLLSNAMLMSHFLGRAIKLPYDEKLYLNELQERVATSRRKENVTEVVSDTSASYAGVK
jgi:predicted dehydrogenase